jgi:DNA-binding MltR family transcriptional regulator
MTKEHEKFLEELRNEVKVFRDELTKESDRGCALFATAYLDKALSDLLFSSVVYEPKKIDKELFEFNSPLGTFSSRIKMAYYLGKISKVARRDLDLLRSIRNKFAHHPAVASFNDESVANQCKELKLSFRKKDDEPRLHFLGSVFGVLAHIHTATFTATAPDQKPDDAPTDEEKAAHRKRLGLDD